ncbi:MAG: dipeptidyl-peptidase 3 family protein [Prolixibacteraceae bacterium]
MKLKHLTLMGCLALVSSCSSPKMEYKSNTDAKKLVEEYAPFTLTSNVSHLSDNQKEMLPLLFKVGKIMDDLYWKQAWGDKESLFQHIHDPFLAKLTKINYGPWNRLDADASFIEGIGKKPSGVQFYPADMTKKEFKALQDPQKTSAYSILVRDKQNNLKVVPYHVAYKAELEEAAKLLNQAAELAEDPGFKKYLQERAKSFLTSKYYDSDVAWMEMKNNMIDFVVGPIESYEDGIFGYKTAFEAFILIKDMEWSKKLQHFAKLLPLLQENLPVPAEYKKEVPGSNSDLGAYDVVYYGGDCNAAGKTIAINLPNDPKVQLLKGSRRLQLKNSMKAKFDKIMLPITKELIAEDQQQYVTFDAFFENTMFHEVAHGLGVKNTIDGKHKVAAMLKEHYSAIEEGKADILGLYMVEQLSKMNELGDNHELKNNYVTFMAGIFRSVRFGATSAHGQANMIRFNYFSKYGAFEKDMMTGKYRINFDKMHEAMVNLSEKLLVLQGNGDYKGVSDLVADLAVVPADLQADLVKLEKAGIPRDIVFNQGVDQLDL